MTRYRANAHVLGYRPGEEFEADGDEAVAARPYVVGGFLSVVDAPEAAPAAPDVSAGDPPVPPAPVDLEALTPAQLRDLAREEGVSPSGSAAAIRDRLRDARAASEVLAADEG